MKEVIFKHVSIKNFLSIGDEPVDIKIDSGIHIITGYNKDKEDGKNGVGKSTIADAIFFAIFGAPLRAIKKDNITNWINKKECSVTITFVVINDGQISEYVLLRSLNPSRVQLIKDGLDVSRTIGKTNDTIYDILGTTPEMFEQSVVMSLNKVEPFLAKTPAVKRKFLEDVFKIEIFSRMTQFIRNDYNETKRIYDFEIEKISDIDTNIQLYKKQQIDQAEKKRLRLNELESRRTSANEEIEHLKKKILIAQSQIVTDDGNNKSELTKKQKEFELLEQQLIEKDKKITKEITVNQTIVLNIKSEINALENVSDGICLYCKQPFSESNKQEKKNLIEQKRKDINECNVLIDSAERQLKHIQKSKNEVEDCLDTITTQIQTIVLKDQELINLNADLRQQEKQLIQTIRDIETFSNDAGAFDGIIEELNLRKDTLQKTADTYKEKLAMLETAKFVVSDEGVKSFIVKKMVKMLNGRLKYYLKELDVSCSCTFNEYFEETIINNRGRECSYFNYSGGESRRIDLGMLFTFKDIRRTQSNISVNLGLYDELLDTSLDIPGIEATLKVLKERVITNKEAIYIISHKNEAMKHATGEVIYLEKENDITRRKQI